MLLTLNYKQVDTYRCTIVKNTVIKNKKHLHKNIKIWQQFTAGKHEHVKEAINKKKLKKTSYLILILITLNVYHVPNLTLFVIRIAEFFYSDEQEAILSCFDWELSVNDKLMLLISGFLPAFLSIPEDLLSGTHMPNPFAVRNRIPRSDLPGIVSGVATYTQRDRMIWPIKHKRVIFVHTKIIEPRDFKIPRNVNKRSLNIKLQNNAYRSFLRKHCSDVYFLVISIELYCRKKLHNVRS